MTQNLSIPLSYIVSKCHKLWSTSDLKLDLHFHKRLKTGPEFLPTLVYFVPSQSITQTPSGIKRLVTLLNYSLRYINNFIYLSIYPTAILNETALVCQQLRFEAPKDVKLEMLISLKNSVSFAMHTLIFCTTNPQPSTTNRNRRRRIIS